MKLVTKRELASMPAGTLYSEYNPNGGGDLFDLFVKQESVPDSPSCDFYSIDLVHSPRSDAFFAELSLGKSINLRVEKLLDNTVHPFEGRGYAIWEIADVALLCQNASNAVKILLSMVEEAVLKTFKESFPEFSGMTEFQKQVKENISPTEINELAVMTEVLNTTAKEGDTFTDYHSEPMVKALHEAGYCITRKQ